MAFVLWLLALGVGVGVMATLSYQWWRGRRVREITIDDYTERLRALDR